MFKFKFKLILLEYVNRDYVTWLADNGDQRQFRELSSTCSRAQGTRILFNYPVLK